MARIISVVSGKGGTGKSTVSASLSLSLASIGCSVLVVDLDIGLRSMDLLLGMENQIVFDIGDVLADKCDIRTAMVAHERYRKLKLLCAPLLIDREFSIPAVISILREAAKGFDYVILDLPAGLGLSVIMAKELADLIVIVTTPDIITLRDTRKTADVLLSNCRKPMRLVINKVSRGTMLAGGVRDLDEVMDVVGAPLLGVVPVDEYVNASATAGARRGKTRSATTQKVFNAMARRVIGEYVPIILRTV